MYNLYSLQTLGLASFQELDDKIDATVTSVTYLNGDITSILVSSCSQSSVDQSCLSGLWFDAAKQPTGLNEISHQLSSDNLAFIGFLGIYDIRRLPKHHEMISDGGRDC